MAYPDPSKGLTKESIRKALQPVRDFELRHHAKIYVGEFSTVIWAPGAAQYLHDLIDIFEEYGWDWSYHAFRKFRWRSACTCLLGLRAKLQDSTA